MCMHRRGPQRQAALLSLLIVFTAFCTASLSVAGGGSRKDQPADREQGVSNRHATQAVLPPEPGRLVLVANWGSDTLSLVDVDAGQALSTIQVGLKPYDIEVDPAGRFAYVTNSGGGDVSVVDVQAMLETARFKVGENPREISLSADGALAVIANAGDDSISIVQLNNDFLETKVQVGSIPYGVALVKQDTQVAVTNWGENSVSVVDIPTRREIGPRIPVGALPYSVVGRGNVAYLTNFGARTITRINLDSLTIDAPPLEVGRSPWGMSLIPGSELAAVPNFYSGDLSIVDLSTNTIASRIPLSTGATAARAKASASAMATPARPPITVVSNLGANELLVVDTQAGHVLRSIEVGKAPYGVQFVPRRQMQPVSGPPRLPSQP